MKNKLFLRNTSRFLAGIMVASIVASGHVTVAAARDNGSTIVENEINVEAVSSGSITMDNDVNVETVSSGSIIAENDINVETVSSGSIIVENDINSPANDSDPYSRPDPGLGSVPIELAKPTNEWTPTTPLDNRVPANFAGGTSEMIPYPFLDSEGKANVLKINYVHDGTSTFGGITLQSPLTSTVEIPESSTIEFDVYYPKSAQGKYMRFRIRTADANADSYMRDYEYNNLNPDWIGSYNGETWLKKHHSITAPKGQATNFTLEIHGENGRTAETGTLLIGDIKISTPDPNGVPLPNVINSENSNDVAPLKSVYNKANGLFMVGAIGTGSVNGTRARHYEIFVDGNNLKADGTHPNGPSWLKSVTDEVLPGATTTTALSEYRFPTSSYLAIRDSGNSGEYKSHGHVLAWYNQAPSWMSQIIPANLSSGYNGTVEFYGLGNGVPATKYKVDKVMARRVQFNHTMYVMRHFLTTDEKYGSSESRGIIPFNSWDVLNEEVHESRHSENIPIDANSWRNSLKHTNWLVAMSDDEISGDITEHYIYLLFKYAHIAAPNAQMAAAYKANYASLPEYMKLDGHDNSGNIDAYIVANPPKLTYNDYGTASRTKARTIYNMVLALNTAWKLDPLYDGRPLIEDIGFQGHDSVGKTLASDNQYAMALCASLVDQGLLSGISFSELDLKLLTDAPGGGATAPAVLNVRQSDALGYQYALLYKTFIKFAPYIDHIMSWGVNGSGWQGSYVLFDENSKANAGYYGAMDPDRFILGHSYLDEYFSGEYDKIKDGYVIDLGDLGTYQPGQNPGGDPGQNPGGDPGQNPGGNPGQNPSDNPTGGTTSGTTEVNVPGVYDTKTLYRVVYDEKDVDVIAVNAIVKRAFESGKDISFAFADKNGKLTYSITLKADTYDSTKTIDSIKLGLDVDTAKEMNHEEGMLLSMKQIGKLPAETVLKVNVGKQFKSGAKVYLYMYNKETKKLECVPNNQTIVDEKGYVNLNINSGADYILLPASANGSEKKGFLSQITYDKKILVARGQSLESIFALPDIFMVVPTLEVFDATKNLATIGATVTYVSHDNKIASFDKEGNIIAKKAGTTKIAVIVKLSNGNSKKYVTTITIK